MRSTLILLVVLAASCTTNTQDAVDERIQEKRAEEAARSGRQLTPEQARVRQEKWDRLTVTLNHMLVSNCKSLGIVNGAHYLQEVNEAYEKQTSHDKFMYGKFAPNREKPAVDVTSQLKWDAVDRGADTLLLAGDNVNGEAYLCAAAPALTPTEIPK